MTKVTIVSRTVMGPGVCIGGITRDERRNVRLLPPSGAHAHPPDAPYAVGDVWEMDLAPAASVVAPHVEDVLVIGGRRIAEQIGLDVWLKNSTSPWNGGAASLFDGRLRLTASAKAYIGRKAVSATSVGFWLPVDDLVLDASGKRYRVPWQGAEVSVKFVGSEAPMQVIVAGTLVRVSLSRWFMASGIDGCWLQISGWYGSSRKALVAEPARTLGHVVAPGHSQDRPPSATVRPGVAALPAPCKSQPGLASTPTRGADQVARSLSASLPAGRSAPSPAPANPPPVPRQPGVQVQQRPAAGPTQDHRAAAHGRALVRELVAGLGGFRVRGRTAPIVRVDTPGHAARPSGRDRLRVHAAPVDDHRAISHAEANLQARAASRSTVAGIRAMADARAREEAEQRRKYVQALRSGGPDLPVPPDWREQE